MSEELERENIDKTKIDWNQHAEYWDTFHDGKVYTKNIIEILSNTVDIKGKNILDFGCGTGLLIDHMTHYADNIVAVDTSEKMLAVLDNKKYANVTTINDELTPESVSKYESLNQKFDVIVAVSVCNFVPNYTEVLQTIKSLLKPDGIFIQWDWLKIESDTDFGFTKETIRESYAEVGLKIQSISIPFHLLENEKKMDVIMAVSKL